MSQVCILTDGMAQFPAPVFPGCELVHLLPVPIYLQGEQVASRDIKLSQLPASIGDKPPFRLALPSVADFERTFVTLGARYSEIVAILSSAQFSPMVSHARQAASAGKSSAAVQVIDSQNCAVGLGLLVQAAAAASLNGCSAAEICRLVRRLAVHVYSAFCIQDLTYLAAAGQIDPAQAVVGEMLGIVPVMVLESGRLVALQKMRNIRHLIDLLYEFIIEFDHIRHVALLRGTLPYKQEVHNLRERLDDYLPSCTISEHSLNAPLATIIGPHSLGVVVMEDYDDIETL